MPRFTRAGSRQRRFALLQGIPSQTSEGDALLTWSPLATVWGHLEPTTTTEQLLAAQRGEEITHTLILEYRSGLLPIGTLRATYANRIFTIVGAVDPDEGHRQLQLKCMEVVTSQVGAM